DALAALELDQLLLGVDRRRARAELELDALLGVVARRLHELILEAVLPAEIALRQRRAGIRQLRVGARQGEGALDPLFAQGDGGGPPCQRSADDHDRGSCHDTTCFLRPERAAITKTSPSWCSSTCCCRSLKSRPTSRWCGVPGCGGDDELAVVQLVAAAVGCKRLEGAGGEGDSGRGGLPVV